MSKLASFDRRRSESARSNWKYMGKKCPACGLEAISAFFDSAKGKYVWKHSRLVKGVTQSTYHEAA